MRAVHVGSHSVPLPRAFASASRNVMMLALCAGISVVIAAVMWGTDLAPLPKYVIGLSLYGALTLLFVISRTRNGVLPLFEYPVALSVLAFVQFGLAPLNAFFSHPDELPPLVSKDTLVNAFPLCVLGMVAFWVGAVIMQRRTYSRPALMPRQGEPGNGQRVLLFAAIMFAVGIVVQVVLNLNMYTPSLDITQLAVFAAQLGSFSLLVVSIEINARRERGWFVALFWTILPLQCVVGFFSGMKGLVLVNLVIVAIVTWIIRQNIPRNWLIAGILGLIFLYPVVNAMRANQALYNVRATGVDSAVLTGREAFEHADEREAWFSSGIRSSIVRRDMLSCVAQVQALGPAIHVIDGEERLWMIPFYPFIPRAIWKNKPIMDHGKKFSILLGGNDETSVALSYVGDAYRLGGAAGAVFAMFCWGMLAEGLVQFLYRDFNRIRLFIYVGLTGAVASSPIESLVFNTWSGMLKAFVLLGATALLVYGRGGSSRSRTTPVPRSSFAHTGSF